jgi:CheY-like chemotaxis protein
VRVFRCLLELDRSTGRLQRSSARHNAYGLAIAIDLVLLCRGGFTLETNSPSYVPSIESMATPVMPIYGWQAETQQVPTGITDVLAIGEEATVFRPVQLALRPTGWAVAHTSSPEAAVAYLCSNVAAVAVAEAELAGNDWSTLVSCLRRTTDAPEVILLTSTEVPLEDALRAGAFDVVQRPFDHSDLLWAVATAWHNWMTRRERGFGGGTCSDA